ncbi:hypothetical protein JQ621_21715 [Bradyrhizobium manausense]|uniref:hypothetical protein n=1 Tax=Bradyrhizobium manausense TaxID=989370 RepID=UPI001BAB6FBF|nr:hypothetical protein [Bradyrhizobium manausense]MBR1090090.1 hypothetical protein [Bradyrhizobium manausense]
MLKIALRPDIFMGIVWAIFIAIYFAIPIQYVHAPGLVAWQLMASGILAFCWGSIVVSLPPPQLGHAADDSKYLDGIIATCAVAGIAGALLIALDKVFLSGQEWSVGITALRDRRFVDVMEGVAIKRSWLLYAGYLTVPFSCASFCLFLLGGEKVGRFAGWLGQASVSAMVIYAILYWSPVPIVLVVVLAISCTFVRILLGRSVLPGGWYLWPNILAVVAGFLIYNNAILASRRQVGNIHNYDDFLRVAWEKWNLRPSMWLDDAARSGSFAAETVMNFISYAFYLTHSPTTVQRFVEHEQQLSAYYGLYQIGILSPLFDVFAPQLRLPETMREQLAAAGLNGWFPNAWCAWLLDGGDFLGLILVVVFWGALSGAAYRAVVKSKSLAGQLMLAFAYTAILLSPFNGPFGMANSVLIFCSFAAVSLWLSLRRAPPPAIEQQGFLIRRIRRHPPIARACCSCPPPRGISTAWSGKIPPDRGSAGPYSIIIIAGFRRSPSAH